MWASYKTWFAFALKLGNNTAGIEIGKYHSVRYYKIICPRKFDILRTDNISTISGTSSFKNIKLCDKQTDQTQIRPAMSDLENKN